jgi:LysM repeat protein
MDPRRRHELTRYGAPAAFLAAVTIAVLLIKAGLDHGSTSQTTTSVVLPTHATKTTKQTTTKIVLTAPTAAATGTTATTTTVAGAQYYVIKSGDTLGGIAAKYHTTVEELMRLNPQVDPAALRPGAQIRVS